MVNLTSVEREVAEIDRLLIPIATAPVDVNDPDWMEKLRRQPPAVDQAGVADRAAVALDALLDAYATEDEPTRARVRTIFDVYGSFRWAVHLPREWTTEAEFRRRLLHLSACDQGSDPRDEMLHLQELCARAEQLGIATEPARREAAAISSDVDRYGMGSTRHLLWPTVEQGT